MLPNLCSSRPESRRLGAVKALNWASIALLSLALGSTTPASARSEPQADVVVIVDTSTSMRSDGMDPERTSLLVTQLLADIVPGEMAAIRLLDLVTDADVLPSEETGMTEPCAENPDRLCGVVAPASDWQADARTQLLGVLARPARGDQSYAAALDGHLEQRANNSMFALAFRAAQGIFEKHLEAGKDLPRSVIWLSDGTSDDPASVVRALRELGRMDVGLEAIIFGRGSTALAEQAGLEARRTASPAELMRAFAGSFRRLVEAPYEIDARLAEEPTFTMQPAVEEAWVVVYGNDQLGEVYVEPPNGERRPANHAQRQLNGAGAYRVAHFENPSAGRYTVSAQGGGDVAYAVVQRSSLRPRLVEPAEATAGVGTMLVVEVVAGEDGAPVSDESLLSGASITISGDEFGAVELDRRDDGLFVGTIQFATSGDATIELHLSSPVVESRVEHTLPIIGFFRPLRPHVEVDLGRLGLGEERCRALEIDAEHEGEVPLTLRPSRRLPAEHAIFLQLNGTEEPWYPGDERHLAPNQALEICLDVGDRAPSSSTQAQDWLTLEVPGGESVAVRLTWQVEGLGFWGRWGWLILSALGVLLFAAIVVGYIVPHRFSPSLALTFVDDREEIDEQLPLPIKSWPGVGIGFYRHARAHLHDNFRISGKARGAVATLVAERRGARILRGKGAALSRETLDGEWEAVTGDGRRVRGGDIYRLGESGPYFRIAMRGGRDI